jgi:hypothetical protein
MLLNVSRAGSVSACVARGIFLHLSRADRVYVGQYQELSVYIHVSACIESLPSTCTCWFVLVPECESSCVGQYQELSMNLHVSALLESLS